MGILIGPPGRTVGGGVGKNQLAVVVLVVVGTDHIGTGYGVGGGGQAGGASYGLFVFEPVGDPGIFPMNRLTLVPYPGDCGCCCGCGGWCGGGVLKH